MKKCKYVVLIILFPIFLISQNVQVEGEFLADSIDVQFGLIKNVGDPINAKDAATKAYVDLLEARLDSLINTLLSALQAQERLDGGETPIQLYNSGVPIDSLYGLTYQGGLITYLNTTTGTGFVTVPFNQSDGSNWGCFGTAIGGTSAAVETGLANTNLIVAACDTDGIPARLCADLVHGGYDDWFLPSKDELYYVYHNLKVPGHNVFVSGGYYSSTEADANKVYYQSFNSGSSSAQPKNYNYGTRAIRAF